MTSENQLPATLDIEEVDMRELSKAIAQSLSQQIGGTFQVRLTKFEHTNRGFTDDRILVNFQIKDESWMERSGMFRNRVRSTPDEPSE